MEGQQHRQDEQDRQDVGRPFKTHQACNQVHFPDAEESAEGKETNGIGRESRDESTDTREVENGEQTY